MTTHNQTQTQAAASTRSGGLSGRAAAAALTLCIAGGVSWWLLESGRIDWIWDEADPGKCLVMPGEITVCEKKHAASGQ